MQHQSLTLDKFSNNNAHNQCVWNKTTTKQFKHSYGTGYIATYWACLSVKLFQPMLIINFLCQTYSLDYSWIRARRQRK